MRLDHPCPHHRAQLPRLWHRQIRRRPDEPQERNDPNPDAGPDRVECRTTSHCGAGGNRTPVHQPVSELATTIPDIDTDAVSPTGRLSDRVGPRLVFPRSQRTFPLSVVFPTVIPHFCCRAVMDWPRATFLLTMTLHDLMRSGCESELLSFGNSLCSPVLRV